MERWAKVAFAALCVATAVGTLVYPTYPVYDSYYALLWGREVLDGTVPALEGFRAPTEHPLAIAAGVVFSLFGEDGDRLWITMVWASFLALVAGLYRLGRVAFSPLVGIVAALLLLSRFDFAFLAARGYIDIPYLALVVWAVALEAARPRRGLPVFALLLAAGWLRPEAWLLLGLYWVWMWPAADRTQRMLWAGLVLAAPAGWLIVDGVATGDPLYSLHHTSASAEDLGRAKSVSEIPGAIPGFLAAIVKWPVMLAGAAGAVAAVLLVPRRAVWPAVLLLSGIVTFVAIGVAGLSAIERYLVNAGLGVLVFAAVAVAGWTLLEPGIRLRRAWAAAAGAGVVVVGVLTVTSLDLRRFDNELRFRGDAHASLVDVLDADAVRAGMRCGPVTVPNHKLVPDVRWIADLPHERVFSRLEVPDQRRGVALVVTGRFALFKHAWTNDEDRADVQLPPAGWPVAKRTEDYTAYARC